jgi:hypothetical protein
LGNPGLAQGFNGGFGQPGFNNGLNSAFIRP